MNISLQNIDKVNAQITAVVEPADYQEKVANAIKDFRTACSDISETIKSICSVSLFHAK